MSNAIKTPIFKDFDLNMKMHPVTGKLIVRKNQDSIKQALRSLILTDRGERPFRNQFGSDIRARLFDLMDPSLALQIESDVLLAVGNYEERAIILNVGVVDDPENNVVRVNITFRTTTSQAPANLTLTLEAIR
jgi:phage baseplate assembly protein W